jgi:hypothetical protein
MKIEFETAVNETSEFQSIIPDERKQRGKVLLGTLEQLQATSPDRLTASEAGIRMAEALEFYLTGKVDGEIIEAKKPKSHKTRRGK